MSNEQYFRTSGFYTACFLVAKGMRLIGVDKTADPKRASFIFVDIPERESHIQSFSSGNQDESGAQVDARKLIAAIRSTKEKLYENSY